MLISTALLIACDGGEIITHTVIKTQNYTVSQTEILTEIQNQTATQTEIVTEIQSQTVTSTETLTEKQVETIIITTTIPATTSPAITTSTVKTPANTAFSISDLTIKPRIPVAGGPFSISVTITNRDSSQGKYDAILNISRLNIEDRENVIIEDTETFAKSVVIGGGESKIVTFDLLARGDGTYTVTIDDLEDYFEVGT
jgi:hypothetical protein